MALTSTIYDRYIRTQPEAIAGLLDAAAIQPHETVCDIGSGDGQVCFEALWRGAVFAIGLELDPELLRAARVRSERFGLSWRAVFLDADYWRVDWPAAEVYLVTATDHYREGLRAIFLHQPRPQARIVWLDGEVIHGRR